MGHAGDTVEKFYALFAAGKDIFVLLTAIQDLGHDLIRRLHPDILRIASQQLLQLLLGRLDEGLTPLRGIEVGGQLDDSGVVESGLAVEIASGGVDEESTPHCGIFLPVIVST